MALLLAGCASNTGATPGSVAGTWLFQVLSSGCPDITGIANGADNLPTEVFQVVQVGNQVSAQFVDNGGNNCSLDGTYHPDEFRGTLRVDDGEVRTVIFSVEGFARDFGSRRQVDGWARVQQDTAGQCVGEIIEFCAIIQSGEIAPQPPSVFFIEPGDDVCVVEGTDVQIIYVDDDLDSQASTSLFADRDGDLLTTEDQVVIAAGRAENDGVTQILDWDTTGVVAGAYTIHAVTTDGQFTANATALGTVEVLCDIPIDLEFATGIEGADDIDPQAIAGFDDGSFVVAGNFEGTATFGAGGTNQTVLTSAGDDDGYVARYNADGTLRWARRAGDIDEDRAAGVAAFPDGSSVVAGFFQGTVDFGDGPVSAAGGRDIFVVRYDADGNALWVRRGAGSENERASAVTALPDGSAVITGCFDSNVIFGQGEPNQTTLIPVGGDDIHIARFASDGSLIYAIGEGGTGDDDPDSITGFADGSVVVCGKFNGTLEIGTETFTAASDDLFVARFDDGGSFVWARVGTSPDGVRAQAATALIDGSVVVTGELDETTVFGPGGPDEVVLTSAGDDDVFVMRLSASGTIQWVRQGGGTGEDDGQAIASFPDGSVIVTGRTHGVATFGAGTSNETTFVARSEERDLFLAHYDLNGFLIWACREGGPENDDGDAIATFADGSFVVTGESSGTKTFGKGDPNETTFDDQIPIARYGGVPLDPPLEPPMPGVLTDAQVLAMCDTVDVVFVIDTSLSMVDDAAALNLVLPQVISQLQTLAATEGGSFTVNATILGITETGSQALSRINADLAVFNALLAQVGLVIPNPPLDAFGFIGDSVLASLGGTVPVDTSQGTLPIANPIDSGPLGFGFESWGSAVAIVAERFAWSGNVVRLVMPVGDEGPEEGLSGEDFTIPPPFGPLTVSIPDRGTCDGVDAASIDNAIAIAQRNDVIVSPITGFLQDSVSALLGIPGSFNTCAFDEGARLANGTDGTHFTVQDPEAAMAAAIFDGILEACRSRVRGLGPVRMIAFDREGDLYQIDPVSGADQEILDTSVDVGLGPENIGVVSSAVYNPQQGQLWLGTGGNAACRGCILDLDVFNGAAAVLADNNEEVRISAHPGLAVRESDGAIFATEGDSSSLLSVNANSGVATEIGNFSIGGNSGNALTFLNGTLYLALNDTLYTVDDNATSPGPVQITPVADLELIGFPPPQGTSRFSIKSMATSNGRIYGIMQEGGGGGGGNNALPAHFAEIDPVNAHVTYIATLSTNLDGLAVVPEELFIGG